MLIGGGMIALPRVVAGNVIAESPVEVWVWIGVHNLPLVECAIWPPGMKTPVFWLVYPTPVATHVATPDASIPHATSVPDVENMPVPVAAAQLAPSYE